jgi:uncharacterized membrane protein YgdD (TMEM256/DUF423 family)
MKLFHRDRREDSRAHRRLYAWFEIAYTVVDFSAAICFILGSVLFFYETTQKPATWLFLIGSVFFAAKPTLRLIREIKLYRMGEVTDLAQRAER